MLEIEEKEVQYQIVLHETVRVNARNTKTHVYVHYIIMFRLVFGEYKQIHNHVFQLCGVFLLGRYEIYNGSGREVTILTLCMGHESQE